MRRATALVFPSLCYEGMPRTILESFAAGTPVIASRHGSMEFLVEHGKTGLHFAPGDSEDLVRQVEWALSHPEEWRRMRNACRQEYLDKYTAQCHYRALMQVYERAMQHGGARAPDPEFAPA
jgi:glycosyltransferase involved in cell wall biosynthesis